MTAAEEREYLIDLLFEGTRWKVDQDEVLNGLELEVRDRLRRLSGVNTVDQDGLCQSDLPDNLPAEDEALTGADYQALEANEHLASPEKVKNAKERWKHGRVRVTIDGKPVWKLESDCHKEIIPGFEKKWHWVWNGPSSPTVGKNLPTKSEQEEAMWAEHEAGNAE